jgi:hypothetical protein
MTTLEKNKIKDEVRLEDKKLREEVRREDRKLRIEVGYDSRKYKLALLVFFAATSMCLFPPFISLFIFKTAVPLIIISTESWVTTISLLMALYYGANVYQKKVEQGGALSVGEKIAKKIDEKLLEKAENDIKKEEAEEKFSETLK